MIIDQLFTPKLIKEGEVYDLGREYGAPPPVKKPHSQDPADHNPYPYSPEEDDDYFREIFRKKRETAAKAKDQDVNEDEQLDEVDWKALQDKMKGYAKGAKEFTKNVKDTGNAAAGMINAYGGAGKELGNQLIARPTSAAYNAAKGGLGKAADVAKGVYGDVKQGTQAVGQAVDTVGTDVGQGLQKVGRGVANVAGGTAGALGSVVGGATTGTGRAAAKGFNAGVKNVGGNAVNRLQTNVFKPTSDPVEIKKQIDLKKQEIADLETELKTAAPVKTGGGQTSLRYGINPVNGKPLTASELRDRAAARREPATVSTGTDTPTTAPAKTTAGGPPGFNAGNVMSLPGMEKYAKKAATPPAKTPNFAGPSGYSKVTQTFKPNVSTAPAAPTAPADTVGTYDKKTGAATLGGKTMVAAKDLPPNIQKQLSGIKEALTQPVAEMLQMVETKEDIQRIKQFVDDTFIKYGAVNESAFAMRNQILEHVTQAGAQRRREHSQRVAH